VNLNIDGKVSISGLSAGQSELTGISAMSASEDQSKDQDDTEVTNQTTSPVSEDA
jgi:hypothetical protein